MKICHITNWLPGYHDMWGGAEQVAFRIANFLTDDNEVFVLATRPKKEVREKFRFEAVPTIEDYLPKFLAVPFSQLKANLFPFDPLSCRFFDKFFQKNRIDIVHLHKSSLLAFSAITAAKKHRIPIVHSFYDFWLFCPLGFYWKVKDFNTYEGEPCKEHQGAVCLGCIKKATKLPPFFGKTFLNLLLPKRGKLFSKYIKQVDKFVVLCNDHKRIPLNYQVPGEKVSVIRLPFSLLDNTILSLDKIDKRAVVFLGWLHPRKGPLVAIDAFKYVVEKFPETKLYMLGSAVDKEYGELVRRRVKEKGLGNSVIFLGKRPFKEAMEYLKKALVLIIPEQFTGFPPSSLFEGMAYGKGIVTGNIGGNLDYIKDGENGFLVKYDDPKEFALKIIRFLANPGLAFTLGQKAREDVQKSNSDKVIKEQLTNLYQSLCQK